MDMNKMHEFIDMYYEELNKRYDNQEKQTQAFILMLKVSEESGELAREVARSFGFASKKKLDRPSKLHSELADVIIYTHLLAKSLGINVHEALATKMDSIQEKLATGDYDKSESMCSEAGCGEECGCNK